LKQLLLICIFSLTLFGCSPASKCDGSQSAGPLLYILFIGNSYTYVNDLPGTFSKLACSGGRKVETAMAAEGGWTLADHAASAQTLEKINQQKWDIVILQEQSEIPALPASRSYSMVPAARLLVSKIRAVGALPVFFMTWGHRDGLPASGLPDYNSMQAQLSTGYTGIAQEQKAAIVPVGNVWQKAVAQSPPLDLWQADGSHPNEKGTYLAACVFYAVLYHQSPVGLSFTAGISQETARLIQTLAADSILKK
jgi:hypothetical protein